MGVFDFVEDFTDDVEDFASGFVGGLSGESQKDAGKQAKKVAKLNAQLARDQIDEQIRRTEAANEQVLGATLARQGASGIQTGAGTTQDFLDEMRSVFQADIDWRTKAGDQQVKVIKEGGNLANQQAIAAGWGTAANTALTVASFWI